VLNSVVGMSVNIKLLHPN